MATQIVWEEVPLGVLGWDARIGAYVLRIDRRDDLPLSFGVWTKVGHDVQFPDEIPDRSA